MTRQRKITRNQLQFFVFLDRISNAVYGKAINALENKTNYEFMLWSDNIGHIAEVTLNKNGTMTIHYLMS